MIQLGLLKRSSSNDLIMGDIDMVNSLSEEPNEYQQIASNLLRHNLEIVSGTKTTALIWLFPVDLISVFDEVYILTFMFDGYPMKGYLDKHNIQQEKTSVKCLDKTLDYEDRVYKLVDYFYPDTLKLRELISVVEKGRINDIGENGEFTYSWWEKLVRDKTHLDWTTLKKNINNFLVNFASTSSSKRILWTTFTKARNGLYSKSLNDDNFVANNIRATNEYKEKDVIIYLVDKRYNPVIKRWFDNNNIKVNEDLYALGEMIQLLWRGAIREGNNIKAYIPSKRMRELLNKFLEMR